MLRRQRKEIVSLREKERQRLLCDCRSSVFTESQKKILREVQEEIVSSQGELFSFHHPFISPPVYRYPTCVRSRGAARAALAGTRRNLVGVDQIGFHPSLHDSAYRGILLILLFVCFHMSDLHVMLVFVFNLIKFKRFTCLPPRDPVQ